MIPSSPAGHLARLPETTGEGRAATMRAHARHAWLGVRTMPGLLSDARQRRLLWRARALVRRLPALLSERLPEMLRDLGEDEPSGPLAGLSEPTIRRIVDLAALLERRSPLGLCLRQALARYHFLRAAGIPLRIHFGVRRDASPGAPDPAIGGHAWVTLHGRPYHEASEHWRKFTVMVSSPEPEPPAQADPSR